MFMTMRADQLKAKAAFVTTRELARQALLAWMRNYRPGREETVRRSTQVQFGR